MTGAELKARRADLGMTQAQLGEELGVAANTIARWEQEVRTIPLWAVKALARLPG